MKQHQQPMIEAALKMPNFLMLASTGLHIYEIHLPGHQNTQYSHSIAQYKQQKL